MAENPPTPDPTPDPAAEEAALKAAAEDAKAKAEASLPTKKTAKVDDDDDIMKEILKEYQSKVSEDVSATIQSLSIPKQIKILKGLIKGIEPAPLEKPKTKTTVNPTDIDEPSPDIDDAPQYKKLVELHENKEAWLKDFMSKDKLYYKGIFNKNV